MGESVAGTLSVPLANARKSQADGTWKVPATLAPVTDQSSVVVKEVVRDR